MDVTHHLRKSSGLGANVGETQASLDGCLTWAGDGGQWTQDFARTCSGAASRCSLFRVCNLGVSVNHPQTWKRTVTQSTCEGLTPSFKFVFRGDCKGGSNELKYKGELDNPGTDEASRAAACYAACVGKAVNGLESGGAGHKLIKAGHWCKAVHANQLSTSFTLQQCADACAAKAGCNFFLYGVAGGNEGYCYQEPINDKSCPSGWKPDNKYGLTLSHALRQQQQQFLSSSVACYTAL